jgi:hypothetical protein
MKNPSAHYITPKGDISNSSFINESISEFTSSFVDHPWPQVRLNTVNELIDNLKGKINKQV